MLFCSMLENLQLNGLYRRNEGNSLPLVLNSVDKTAKVQVVEGKSLTLSADNLGKDVFAYGDGKNPDDVVVQFNDKFVEPLTYGETADTEENPILVVCSKGIRFFEDVPTYLNVLFVDEAMMFVSLIFGACEFQFPDGSFVALERCNKAGLTRKSTNPQVYTGNDLQRYALCKTEGGWDKSYEMVCPMFVKASKKQKSISFKLIKENALIFNPKAIEDRELYEESLIKKREEAARKRQAQNEEVERKRQERIAKIQEGIVAEQRMKEEQEKINKEIEEAQKAEARKASRKSRSTSKAKSNTYNDKGRNTGAEAFLAFINND